MHTSHPTRSNARSSRVACTVTASLLVAVLGAPIAATADERRLRWDLDEKPIEEQGLPRRVGSNLRDGTIGIVDGFFQGVSTGFAFFFVRGGGLLGQKLGTIGGDVVGLVDANPASKHVFRGIASRQLLRYGALAEPSGAQLASIYDTDFDRIQATTLDDFVGPQWFHTRAWTTSSVVLGVPGTAVASLIVRPSGGLLTVFGLRGAGEEVDALGVEIVERSLAVPFL